MDKDMMWFREENETESRQIPILHFLGPTAVTLAPEDREARLTVCGSCPSQAHGQCLENNSYVPVTSWQPTEDCPLNKWQKKYREVVNPDQEEFEAFLAERLGDAG